MEAFKATTLNWNGHYDQFNNVPMEISSLQKPHPPLWYGAHSPDSAERAARKGLNIVTNDMPDNTRAIIARYRQVWRDVQSTKSDATPPKMGMVRFILVAETDTAALAIARRAFLRWRRSFSHAWELNGTQPQSPLCVDNFDILIKQGQAIAGSPETVRAFLASQIEESGVNYVVGQFCFGDLTLDEMLRSVELFATKVAPALAKIT
jgi:alkanesulfonate monooxygenase SsuD/methylene tetrahydromethanopterin reductase-like flavin-dependent oxidoreductase (luciferase family)